MTECIPEDVLLELASGQRSLGDAREVEAHLADCAECSGVLSTLVDSSAGDEHGRDRVGQTLGPYRLDGLIGAGAMGEVYHAWDQRLERRVAVKLLSAQGVAAPDRIRRLEAEARAAAAIAHPNVVTIYDTGTADGVPYVVSELIVGESLRSMIDRGAVDGRRALDLGLQLARGVAAAHAQGVIHRDLKPSNLIVTEDGTLKILDFGLAKVTSERDADATEPGTLVGTCGYLAPEQARGERADVRSDIFAIGAILYELLAGRRAFEGATFAERLSAVLRDTPPVPDDPAAPIVMRCLDKDPRKRFQSAADLAWALEAQRDDRAPPRSRTRAPATVSRRTFLAGAAVTGAGGLVLGRWLAPSPRPPFVPEYRQLTFRHGRVGRARFTPDGGSVVYSAVWEERPSTLYTARLGGGGTRMLDVPPAQLLAVSSRGQLALALHHEYIEGFHHRGQLAVAPLEGGAPRTLGVDVQDADFTPDGHHLAVVRRVNGKFRLELPVGNALLEAGWLSHPRVSPDGSLVACLVHDGPHDDRGDLVVVPRTGGAPRTIAAGWSSIDGLAWSPNGRSLWVSASRAGGNNSVRAVALDGRELRHVPAAGRLRVHDLSRAGTLAVTHVSGRLRLFAKAPGATEERELGLSDISLAADMSRDGRAVITTEFGDVDTARGIYLLASDGSRALPIGGGLAFDLADDDRGVLGLGRTLAAFPIEHGTPQPLSLGALSKVHSARWCADGGTIVAATSGESPGLWRLDRGGSATPITTEDAFAPFHVSPDGRTVARIANGRLLVHDVMHDVPARIVAGSFTDEAVCGWAKDGRELFVRSKAWPIRVRRVDAASGASAPVLEVTPPRLGLRSVYAFVISETADAYAYSYAQELSRLYSMTTEERAG